MIISDGNTIFTKKLQKTRKDTHFFSYLQVFIYLHRIFIILPLFGMAYTYKKRGRESPR
jgi:hypothetical protein